MDSADRTEAERNAAAKRFDTLHTADAGPMAKISSKKLTLVF